MKLKFEEAISVPDSERRSIADSIDYHTIGVQYASWILCLFSIFAANLILKLFLQI